MGVWTGLVGDLWRAAGLWQWPIGSIAMPPIVLDTVVPEPSVGSITQCYLLMYAKSQSHMVSAIVSPSPSWLHTYT